MVINRYYCDICGNEITDGESFYEHLSYRCERIINGRNNTHRVMACDPHDTFYVCKYCETEIKANCMEEKQDASDKV